MKWKERFIFIICISLILFPFTFVSGYKADTSISQWDSTMIIHQNVEYNDTINFSPPKIFEFGGKDQFSFTFPISHFKNVTQSNFSFSINGNKSYWYKSDFGDRSNVINLFGFENESSSVHIFDKQNYTSLINIYFTSNLTGCNGKLFGFNFSSTSSSIVIEKLNMILQFNQWYQMNYNISTKKINVARYYNYNLCDQQKYQLDNASSFKISINSTHSGVMIRLDGFEYRQNNAIYFNSKATHEWNPKSFMGINTTKAIISSTLMFSNTHKINQIVDQNFNSSVLVISYRSPFNLSSKIHSFYIAKIFADIPIYKYSENGSKWISVGMGEILNLEISYKIDDTLKYLQIGNYKTQTVSNNESYLSGSGAFKIMHEGYSNESYSINFQCITDGILPKIEYKITYDYQRSINEHGWINVTAKNALDKKSGIFSADGMYKYYLNNGHTSIIIYNTIGKSEMNFIVLLYSLDGTLFLRKIITIKIIYFNQKDDDPISIWISKNLKWIIAISFTLIGIGIIKIKKNRYFVEKSNIPKNVKTFYPNIGEVPKGCNITKGKLICKK